MLLKKSLHELRSIAQGYGVTDVFSKTDNELRQAISLKQQEMAPKPVIEPVKPEYDARLMKRPPAKLCTQESLSSLLAPHIERGMHLTFPSPEEWHMRWGKREDTGTMRQPPRNVLECANRLMR